MTTFDGGIVVVGGGQAAAQTVDSLRRYGYTGALTLVSDEPVLPYQRPPLSKQYLSGDKDPNWLLHRPAEFYAARNVRVLLGRRATAIDRGQHAVTLDCGSAIRYDRLVLVTGCRVRTLAVPGADAPGVNYLRTLEDVDRIRARLDGARRVVIVGGGFIGLEAAAIITQMNREVTVLETHDRVLNRVVTPLVAKFFTDRHRHHGVRIVTGARVASIVEKRRTLEVVRSDGDPLEADLIIIGIGVEPNVELAESAGLKCENGIVVDEYAQTSDPAIVAAGDCTVHPSASLGQMVRLETVHNAIEQAKTAAATLVGSERPYHQVPWVWSDQYALRLQTVGAIENHEEEILRGDPDANRFSLFYFANGRLCAAQCVNRPADFAASRRIMNETLPFTSAQAADPTFPLQQLLPKRGRLTFDVPWTPRRDRRTLAEARI